MMVATSRHVVDMGRIRARPSLGRKWEVHTAPKEEGIYVLYSSFEVIKPSRPGSLPSTCKVLCLGLWRLGDLAHHT
jgi:hypothetical protein